MTLHIVMFITPNFESLDNIHALLNPEYTVCLFFRELREITNESKYNVTVFNPYFIYFDQFLVVLPNTVQCVGLAAVIMLVVSLVLIPNPICSLWVAFSIMSIELGVLGFMAFWGINLDSISMINLIMSIGFAVDFAAHISYSYMDSEGTPDDRVRNSLYSLGLPIVQVSWHCQLHFHWHWL